MVAQVPSWSISQLARQCVDKSDGYWLPWYNLPRGDQVAVRPGPGSEDAVEVLDKFTSELRGRPQVSAGACSHFLLISAQISGERQG
eukprot:g16736.t1